MSKFRESEYKKNARTKNQFRKPKQMIKEKEITGARKDRLIDWITFYRRNIHWFIHHYFGIQLYPYQIIWLYLMSVSDIFVTIAARAAGKSWLLAVFALAKGVLYPNSEIIIVSSTQKQAGLIVSEKCQHLVDDYPNIAREVKVLTANMNRWEVLLHNGSKIKVVAAGETGRGNRSTFTIYEEFRLIDKNVVDSVIKPFAYSRQAPFLRIPEYSHLVEEPKEVFISSAYHKGLWWFDETRKIIKMMLDGLNAGFIAFDYNIAVKHNIKTPAQIEKERSTIDDIVWLEEYENIPWGESADAYLKLSAFEKVRTIKKAFYPQRREDFNEKKNPYDLKLQDGEIRIISVDVATRKGSKNDNTIIACMRLLPTNRGYDRDIVYMESHNGENTTIQTLRIKQILYDFNANYLVLDLAQSGIAVYDQLGTVTKDDDRGIEYPAYTVMNHESLEDKIYEELFQRTTATNAIPIIYPISANAKLNNDIAVEMRDKLKKKMLGLLVEEVAAEDYLTKTNKEFLEFSDDFSMRPWYLHPYVQTTLLVNESVNLAMAIAGGNIKLVEPVGARKDRFTSVAYGNYFAMLLDQELLKERESVDTNFLKYTFIG